MRTTGRVALALLLQGSLLAALPVVAQQSPATVHGATAWLGSHSALHFGASIPLADWPSVFNRLIGGGRGQLVLLVGNDEAGLALGHAFPDVRAELGKVAAGAAVGVGYAVPYSQSCSPAPANCRQGLASGHLIVFVNVPMELTK